MAFGQVQGSAGGGPPLPQILTHLKEAEQQGQSTILGKGFLHMSRMVHLPWVSVGGPHPHPGARRSTSVLSLVKRVGL